MERIKTGIKGFDALIEGGIPQGSNVMLCGTAGCGKTLFALEFMYNGASKFNEKSLFVTFEEDLEGIYEQARQFNWDFMKYQQRGLLSIINIPPTEITNNTINDILQIAAEKRISRLVIDSLSTLSLYVPNNTGKADHNSIGRFLHSFIGRLKSTRQVTSLIINQSPDEKSLSKDNISEFICDGVIHLVFESMGGEYSRSLLVRKMRRTKNDEDIHPLEISAKGLIVHNIK
jgi:KaiC/GvpD/RAD55 family RecA-like ATPase